MFLNTFATNIKKQTKESFVKITSIAQKKAMRGLTVTKPEPVINQ